MEANLDGEWRLLIHDQGLETHLPIYTLKGGGIAVSDGSTGTYEIDAGKVLVAIEDPDQTTSHGMLFDLPERDRTLGGMFQDGAIDNDYYTDCFFLREVLVQEMLAERDAETESDDA